MRSHPTSEFGYFVLLVLVQSAFSSQPGDRKVGNSQLYHLYGPKINMIEKTQAYKPPVTGKCLVPPLVDEIDAEKVQDQTAHDIVGEGPVPRCQHLVTPRYMYGGRNSPFWRHFGEVLLVGLGRLNPE